MHMYVCTYISYDGDCDWRVNVCIVHTIRPPNHNTTKPSPGLLVMYWARYVGRFSEDEVWAKIWALIIYNWWKVFCLHFLIIANPRCTLSICHDYSTYYIHTLWFHVLYSTNTYTPYFALLWSHRRYFGVLCGLCFITAFGLCLSDVKDLEIGFARLSTVTLGPFYFLGVSHRRKNFFFYNSWFYCVKRLSEILPSSHST